MLTEVYILEHYGLRLNVEQLAEVLGYSKSTMYNMMAKGDLSIPTYLDSGKRFADYRDVARHIDECRARAKHEEHNLG